MSDERLDRGFVVDALARRQLSEQRRREYYWRTRASAAASVAQRFGIWFVTPVLLVAGGTGSVSWTTVSLTSYVPIGATAALLILQASDTAGGGAAYKTIDIRKDVSGSVYTMLKASTHLTRQPYEYQQVLVPLSDSRSFDYQVPTGFDDNFSITLHGYQGYE